METENKNTPVKKTTSKNKKKKNGASFSKMSKKRKQRYIRRGVLGGIAVVGIIVVAMVLNMVYSIFQDTAAFDPEKLLRFEPFTILDSNDEPIYQYGVSPVSFEEIPQVMIDAIVAAEDSRYYEHNGFDVPRIISALIGNIKGGEISSGASTITQQTIKKNYYPNEEQTYTRKIGEIFLAIQADAQMDKDEVLTCYLNTVSYGVGLTPRGIKAASKYYFGKDVSQLTLPEAAYLAGALNAPSAYDAFYNLDLATQRRNTILYLMELHGYITNEEYELAKATKLENQLVEAPDGETNYEQYQAYIDAVLEEVLDELYRDQMTEDEIQSSRDELTTEVLNKSITVHTFMDADLQHYLESEIATENASNVNYYGEGIEVAGSVQDNFNGRIVGLLGGRDYVDYTLNEDLQGPKAFGYNRATSGKQSPGSSLKPLVAYGPGIELLDWPTYASVTDDEYINESGTKLYNWDGRTHGSMSMAQALGDSWNIPAVKALKEVVQSVGRTKVIDYINGLGLTVNGAYNYEGEWDEYGDFNYLYAIGAWAEGVTMVQEAGAYATVANGGTYYKPHTINYIEYNNNGEKIMVDERITSEATRALSEQGAFMIRELMKDYTHGVGSGSFYYVNTAANQLGIKVGAKTGTSTNQDDDVKGYLLACFTPDYAMSFWLGKDNSSEPISTSNIATPRAIAGHVITELHRDGVVHEYSPAPAGVHQATVQLGKEPSDKCYIANSYVPDQYKITGWYKDTNPPMGTQTPSISNLESFSVESINDKALKIAFGAYDSRYTDLPTDSNQLNPDYMYGRVVYVTIIRDNAGNEILSHISEEPNLTIDYNVSQEIQVCGRYQYSEATNLASNEKCVTIKPKKINLPEIVYDITANGISIVGGSTNSKNVTVSVDASLSDNKITIVVNGDNGYNRSKSFKGSGSIQLNGLQTGNYTVSIIEQDNNQTNQVTTNASFSVVEEEED